MKVLILGSTSVIGRYIGRYLEDHGLNVEYAGRLNYEHFFDLIVPKQNYKSFGCFDTVIHTASCFEETSVQDMFNTEQTNSAGMFNACHVAQQVHAKHFIILSSIFSHNQPGDAYYGPYSISKKHGEENASFFCKANNINLTVLRPSQIYDSSLKCRHHQKFFYALIDKISCGEDIVVEGSNDAIRNFLHIEDLCEIIINIINQRHFGSFDCIHPQSTTLTNLAKTISRIFNTTISWSFDKEKKDIPSIMEKRDLSIYQKINFYPKIDLFDGIQRIRSYMESHVPQKT